jgi:hypothetical protein
MNIECPGPGGRGSVGEEGTVVVMAMCGVLVPLCYKPDRGRLVLWILMVGQGANIM